MDRNEWIARAKRGTVYSEWPFRILPWLAGQDGFTPGPFTFIRPRSKRDESLHVHEYQHRYQFSKNPVRYFGYVVDKKTRFDLEVEAYAAQLSWFAREIWSIRVVGYATNLSQNYSLNKSFEDCRDAILAKADGFVAPYAKDATVPPAWQWPGLMARFMHLK